MRKHRSDIVRPAEISQVQIILSRIHTNLLALKAPAQQSLLSRYPHHRCSVQSVLKEQIYAKITTTSPSHAGRYLSELFLPVCTGMCQSALECAAVSCHDMGRGGCHLALWRKADFRNAPSTTPEPRSVQILPLAMKVGDLCLQHNIVCPAMTWAQRRKQNPKLGFATSCGVRRRRQHMIY